MTNTSMAGLSETLQQRLKNDQQAVSNQTQELLQLHAKALRQLSVDALSTTDAAISEMQSVTLQRVRRLMMLPLLASLCLSVLIVSGASVWAWWKIGQCQADQLNQIEASPAGQGRTKG